MARFPPPVTMITCSMPDAIASSTPYWIVGLSKSGSISFGCALVTGRNRVPRPAAVMIALRTGLAVIEANLAPGPGRRSAALLGQMKGERLEARVFDHHPRRRPLAAPGLPEPLAAAVLARVHDQGPLPRPPQDRDHPPDTGFQGAWRPDQAAQDAPRGARRGRHHRLGGQPRAGGRLCGPGLRRTGH